MGRRDEISDSLGQPLVSLVERPVFAGDHWCATLPLLKCNFTIPHFTYVVAYYYAACGYSRDLSVPEVKRPLSKWYQW